MTAAVEESHRLRLAMVTQRVTCPRCGQVLALWDAETDDWQPLGARIKRTDRGRPNFVCPVCGTAKRIPDDRNHIAKPGDAA